MRTRGENYTKSISKSKSSPSKGTGKQQLTGQKGEVKPSMPKICHSWVSLELSSLAPVHPLPAVEQRLQHLCLSMWGTHPCRTSRASPKEL